MLTTDFTDATDKNDASLSLWLLSVPISAHPWLNCICLSSVILCCFGGEPRVLSRPWLAVQYWRAPDSTRPGKVPTPAGKVRTFSRHLGHVLDAMFGVNRDIRLEMRVASAGPWGYLCRNSNLANQLGNIPGAERGWDSGRVCVETAAGEQGRPPAGSRTFFTRPALRRPLPSGAWDWAGRGERR